MAFGVHRALDTTGAMIGPLVAFRVLFVAPQGYDAIFMVSFCFAIVGLAVLLLFVENRPARATSRRAEPLRAIAIRRLLSLPGLRAADGRRRSRSALATTSDGFIYLGAAGQAATSRPQPSRCCTSRTSLVYMLLAVPVGRLADRVGRGQVFVAGYAPVARRLCARCCCRRRLGGRSSRCIALGHVLRRDRRRADGARQQRCCPEASRGTGAVADRHGDQHRPAARVDRIRALWTTVGVDTAIVIFAAALVAARRSAALVLDRHAGGRGSGRQLSRRATIFAVVVVCCIAACGVGRRSPSFAPAHVAPRRRAAPSTPARPLAGRAWSSAALDRNASPTSLRADRRRRRSQTRPARRSDRLGLRAGLLRGRPRPLPVARAARSDHR